MLDENQSSFDAKQLPRDTSPNSPRNPDVIPSLVGLGQRYETDPLVGMKRAHVNFLEPSPDDAGGFELGLGPFPTPVATLDYDPSRLDLALSATRHVVHFDGSEGPRKYESETYVHFTPPSHPRHFANTYGGGQVSSADVYGLNQTMSRQMMSQMESDDQSYNMNQSLTNDDDQQHSHQQTQTIRNTYEPGQTVQQLTPDQIPLQTISSLNRTLTVKLFL